ncbi:hypothetical protein [Actinoplanes sp. L3-i22]|uniref:hypothetical protein n=1 Tax=Actinoplanes sp. L3-i22 TaxID=2836373 RepID=UPI001C860FEA|nr:hypothetical protein [Actinoplanes sp. L3-i22]
MQSRQEPRRSVEPAVRRDVGPNRTHLAPDVARAHLLQRTIGNAATGLVLQRVTDVDRARWTAKRQRVVKVTPDGYAAAHGAAGVAALTREQLRDYLVMAFVDDLQMATGYAEVPADITAMETATLSLRQLGQAMQAMQPGAVVGAQADFLTGAVEDVNRILTGRANHETRYSVEPTGGYEHNSRNKKAMKTTWPDSEKMWETIGPALGTDFPAAATGVPRVAAQRPIGQLAWSSAKSMLPRPMLNLLFDVRFQLESGTLVDERTDTELAAQEKSPHAPGTLRSWHQDDSGRLGGTGIAPGTPAAVRTAVTTTEPLATDLHDHYDERSQSGAGSSVQNAATGPRGLAEYTGAGTNSEHFTKIVLDYVNKRVYLTLTHYQFWALADRSGTAEFWNLGTQNEAEAQGQMRARERQEGLDPGSATLMSPWIEITGM